MADEESLFDQFWEASSLDTFNVQQFSQRLNSYDSDNKELYLEFPEAASAIPQPQTQLNKIAKKRVSTRSFSGEELSVKELGILMSSFYAWNGLEHRGFPSAGATYTTEIFAMGFNLESFGGKILYYDPERHGIVIINDTIPTWKEASKSLNIDIKGTPGLLVLLVMFPERAIAKYGERGGRFALLEAGAALQQLSLQIASSSKLKGVAVGGMLDSVWLDYLQLRNTGEQIALGYLIGK